MPQIHPFGRQGLERLAGEHHQRDTVPAAGQEAEVVVVAADPDRTEREAARLDAKRTCPCQHLVPPNSRRVSRDACHLNVDGDLHLQFL